MPHRVALSALLAALAQHAQRRRQLEATERELVAQLRAQGASWQAIAEALGRPRQNVHRKYRDVDR